MATKVTKTAKELKKLESLYNLSYLFHKWPRVASFLYNISYFPQLGLMRDDAVRKDDPVVMEAVRRLPKDLAAQRQFRISRALHLSYKGVVLPRDEWMTVELDVPYLQPYIAQVKAEIAKKKAFEKEVLSFRIPKK